MVRGSLVVTKILNRRDGSEHEQKMVHLNIKLRVYEAEKNEGEEEEKILLILDEMC